MTPNRHLERLDAITRLLLRSLATETLAEGFAALGPTLSLASVILIRESANGARIDLFHRQASPPPVTALTHATDAWAWLACCDEPELRSLRNTPPALHPTLPEPAGEGPEHFIVLPLVSANRLCGVLQLHSVAQLDKDDLSLADGVANTLMVALDREHATERLEEMLAGAQAAVRSREQVLAMISHDLANMLTGVVLHTAVALQGGPIDRSLAAINTAATRMSRLIRDLVDASALETGKLTVDFRPCAPTPLLSQAMESVAPDARRHSITLANETAGDVPTIDADGERLLQVLSNLLSNAISLTPTGGAIRLRAEALSDAVCFSVSDTGPGIRSEDLAHVFDREWRAPGTRYLGRGLGLFIARGIVEAHGGRIWVESSPGKGATFWFSVPTLHA